MTVNWESNRFVGSIVWDYWLTATLQVDLDWDC